jgi:hypothetical protein
LIALTKSQKVSAKNCGQIVAKRVRASVLQLGHAYAIAGFALLFDALPPFVSPAHRGRQPYWTLLAAGLAQQAHLGRLLEAQKHQRYALLAGKAVAQPRCHLGPTLGPPKHQRPALLLAVKSTPRRVLLEESLQGRK